jgi:hypothetical protein
MCQTVKTSTKIIRENNKSKIQNFVESMRVQIIYFMTECYKLVQVPPTFSISPVWDPSPVWLIRKSEESEDTAW